jgi:hypothetical protein
MALIFVAYDAFVILASRSGHAGVFDCWTLSA